MSVADPTSAFFSPSALTAARVASGISPVELAAAAKVSISTLEALEAGEFLPGLATAYSLAKGCGVDLVSLYSGEPESTRVAEMTAVNRARLAAAPGLTAATAARLATLFGAVA